METIKLKLNSPIDEIRYCLWGFRMGEETIIRKSEVSEDEWNQRINNLVFYRNGGPEGLHCSLYYMGREVYSGMLDWDCWHKQKLNPDNASSEFEYDINDDF